MLGYRQCVGSMFTHVKWCSFGGSVGVRLRSEVVCIAADQPIGGQQASVQHWVCQTPHRRIVWMFVCRSALVWRFLVSWLFFLCLNCLFMISFMSFLLTLYCFKTGPSWRRCDEESLENALVTFAHMVTKVVHMSISSLLKLLLLLTQSCPSVSCWSFSQMTSDSSKHR